MQKIGNTWKIPGITIAIRSLVLSHLIGYFLTTQ